MTYCENDVKLPKNSAGQKKMISFYPVITNFISEIFEQLVGRVRREEKSLRLLVHYTHIAVPANRKPDMAQIHAR